MKEKRKVIITILIIVFIILAILLFNNKNLIITKLVETKEQLTTDDGVISTSEHLAQMANTEKQAYEQGKQDGTLKITSLGTSNISGAGASRTFSAKSIENYEELTISNFAIRPTGISYNRSDSSSGGDSCSVSMSYTDGILTISTKGNTNANFYGAGNMSFEVLCFHL